MIIFMSEIMTRFVGTFIGSYTIAYIGLNNINPDTTIINKYAIAVETELC